MEEHDSLEDNTKFVSGTGKPCEKFNAAESPNAQLMVLFCEYKLAPENIRNKVNM